MPYDMPSANHAPAQAGNPNDLLADANIVAVAKAIRRSRFARSKWIHSAWNADRPLTQEELDDAKAAIEAVLVALRAAFEVLDEAPHA